MPSLRNNVAANVVGQLYVALVGVVFVPVYMRLLGGESYGLVAFFALIQSWFQLFDLGFTATISREAARYLGGNADSRHLRQLLRSLEAIFWSIGLFAALVLMLAAPGIATRWLSVQELPTDTVVGSLAIMAIAISLRWISGLYRGAITGLEKQVWLSTFSVVVVSLRFIGVTPVLLYVHGGAIAFFVWQALISCIELVVLAVYTYSQIPRPQEGRVEWSWKPLSSVLGFSATAAFTSAVGVLISHVDKLVLSKRMLLEDYGYFTAAVLVASTISLAAAPVATALLPRLTRLSVQDDQHAFLLLYRQATQAIVAVTSVGAVVLGVLAEQVLWAWTGNAEMAQGYSGILAMYAVGNAFLSVTAFQYYLQFARGDIRLHLWGNIGFLAVLVPTIVAASLRYGAVGSGIVWVAMNVLFFIAWVPVVHRRFLPGRHGAWLARDVLNVAIVPVAAIPLLMLAPDHLGERWLGAAGIALTGICLAGLTLMRCDLLRPPLQRAIMHVARGLR